MLEILKNNLWTLPCALSVFLLGTILLIKTRFFILLNLPKIFSSTIGKIHKQKKAFRMMCTSLGGTIGVGNAVGVAGAIAEGGAGAVFWMGIASIFSMIIKYAEIYLAVLFKKSIKAKGPLAYFETGINSKLFAYIYSFLCILVSLGMGNLSQMKAALSASKDVLPLPTFLLSIILMIVFVITALGGLDKISSFSQTVVPIMSLSYIILLTVILFKSNISLAFSQILNTSGIYGGIKWSIIRKGISGGFSKAVFSSEAGLGSAGFTHCESEETPHSQGLWGVVEVFIDSLICIMTALAILSMENIPDFKDVSFVTKGIFQINFGFWGEIFYAVSIIFFALSSMLCWYYIGVSVLKYISENKKLKNFYTTVFSLFIVLSALISSSVIIDLSDIANAFMMLVNIPALFVLIKKIKTN